MTNKEERNQDSKNYWTLLSADLGVRVDVNAMIPDLEEIGVVSAIVRGFGGENGMIIVDDYDQIENHVESILGHGYGFSTFSPGSSYSRSDAIEMLRDWGWRLDTSPPSWLS